MAQTASLPSHHHSSHSATLRKHVLKCSFLAQPIPHLRRRASSTDSISFVTFDIRNFGNVGNSSWQSRRKSLLKMRACRLTLQTIQGQLDMGFPSWATGFTVHTNQARSILEIPSTTYPQGQGCTTCVRDMVICVWGRRGKRCAWCIARKYSPSGCQMHSVEANVGATSLSIGMSRDLYYRAYLLGDTEFIYSRRGYPPFTCLVSDILSDEARNTSSVVHLNRFPANALSFSSFTNVVQTTMRLVPATYSILMLVPNSEDSWWVRDQKLFEGGLLYALLHRFSPIRFEIVLRYISVQTQPQASENTQE